MKGSKKVLLAAAMTTLASTSYLASTDSAYAAGGKSQDAKKEKGQHERCADGSCGDKSKDKKAKKGEKHKCADGSCGDKGKKKKGDKMKCADGSCGSQ